MSIIGDAPGPTQLYFNVIDEESHVNVLLRSDKSQIEVGKELVQYIDERSDMSYHVN